MKKTPNAAKIPSAIVYLALLLGFRTSGAVDQRFRKYVIMLCRLRACFVMVTKLYHILPAFFEFGIAGKDGFCRNDGVRGGIIYRY